MPSRFSDPVRRSLVASDLISAAISASSSMLRSRSHSRVIPSATAATEAITQSVAASGAHCWETTTHPTSMGTAATAVGAQASVNGP